LRLPVFCMRQLVALAKSGRFRFVVKLHGRCQRVLHPDITVSAGDQYLNPLTPVEVDSIELLAGVDNIEIVDGRFHNLLPFLDAFDTVCTRQLLSYSPHRDHAFHCVDRLCVTWTPAPRLRRRTSQAKWCWVSSHPHSVVRVLCSSRLRSSACSLTACGVLNAQMVVGIPFTPTSTGRCFTSFPHPRSWKLF
jgi:hypothetical protein